MLPFNQINESIASRATERLTTTSLDRLLNGSRLESERSEPPNPITITSLLSNTSSASTSRYQPIAADESYSVKTGIKTGALLGGTSSSALAHREGNGSFAAD